MRSRLPKRCKKRLRSKLIPVKKQREWLSKGGTTANMIPVILLEWIFLQEPLSAAVTMNDERSFLLSIMSEEKKIKVVLLEPGKLASTAEIDASLAGMQKTVGGLIEPFYPFEEQVCIVCNEESKINGMRPNRSVKNDDGVMVDFIFGPAFICDCRGENLDSLSDEQIDRYGKMFRYPEHLARVNGTLLGIPYRPQPEQER